MHNRTKNVDNKHSMKEIGGDVKCTEKNTEKLWKRCTKLYTKKHNKKEGKDEKSRKRYWGTKKKY